MNLEFNYSTNFDIEGFRLLTGHMLSAKDEITRRFPKLAGVLENSEDGNVPEEISRFVADTHQQDANAIERGTAEAKKTWLRIRPRFEELTGQLFPGVDLTDISYVAYPSIWPLHVRDFSNERLSFPYSDGADQALFVICHELLHVVFYEYLALHHPELTGDERQNDIWDLSEILNVLIQNEPEWVELTGLKPEPYPQHRELHAELKQTWANDPTIKSLIRTFVTEIRPR